MSRSGRRQSAFELPPLYAMVQPGLEPIAADEINRVLGGEIKKVTRGLVVFRVNEVTPEVLNLRTTDDVFLLAWWILKSSGQSALLAVHLRNFASSSCL